MRNWWEIIFDLLKIAKFPKGKSATWGSGMFFILLGFPFLEPRKRLDYVWLCTLIGHGYSSINWYIFWLYPQKMQKKNKRIMAGWREYDHKSHTIFWAWHIFRTSKKIVFFGGWNELLDHGSRTTQSRFFNSLQVSTIQNWIYLGVVIPCVGTYVLCSLHPQNRKLQS